MGLFTPGCTSLKEWHKELSKFLGKPKLPQYKDKESGRYTLAYTIQAISAKLLRIGQVKPSGLGLLIKPKQTDIAQVRIVPKKTHYVVEVVYNVEPESFYLFVGTPYNSQSKSVHG